jgi:hypothetical protein
MGTVGGGRAGGLTGRSAARLAWSALACSLLLAAAVAGRTVQPAGASLWLRPRIGRSVTETVTMPERWDGRTAREEVP